MKKFLDEFLSKEEQHKLSNFSKKAKQELASLPILSVIGDATRGAAGLGELQERIKKDPENPKHWLFLYEASIMNEKLNSGVGIGRAVINPVGYIAGKGIATGLNAVDEDYQETHPNHYLGMALTLTMKHLKNGYNRKARTEDLVILGKALGYSSEYSTTNRKKFNMLNKAIKYMSKAIAVEKRKKLQSEYFFYLANLYKQSFNERMYLRSLNISRKMGFKPAEKLLKTTLKGKTNDSTEKSKLDQASSHTPFNTFKYTYQPDFDSRLDHSWEHVKKQQSEKIKSTSERILNFLDKKF